MHTYDRAKISSGQESSLKYISDLIVNGSTVLDVGCGTGALGEYLSSEKNCVVDGVDINLSQIKLTRENYRNVYVSDLETDDVQNVLNSEKYDYIVCADVIEHIKNSEILVDRLCLLLKDNGCMIFSVPNVAHIGIIIGLIGGEFNYSKEGLLDETHIKFFTLKSILDYFARHSLVPIKIMRVKVPLESSEFRSIDSTVMPDNFLRYLRGLGESDTYQFIIKAKIKESVSDDELVASKDLFELSRSSSDYFSFRAQLYWKLGEATYQEENSNVQGVRFSDSFQKIVLDIPVQEEEIKELRLDVANKPGVVALRSIKIYDLDSRLLWSFNDEKIDIGNIALHDALIYEYCEESHVIKMLLHSDDSYLILPIKDELLVMLKKGASLEMDVSWSVTPDFMLCYNKIKNELVPLKKELVPLKKMVASLHEEIGVLREHNKQLQEEIVAIYNNTIIRRVKAYLKRIFSLFSA